MRRRAGGGYSSGGSRNHGRSIVFAIKVHHVGKSSPSIGIMDGHSAISEHVLGGGLPKKASRDEGPVVETTSEELPSQKRLEPLVEDFGNLVFPCPRRSTS